MYKKGLVKRTWLLAGLILGIPLVLLSLYSFSALGRRSEALPPWQNAIMPGKPDRTPTAGVGAVLSIEMTARGYWIPASLDGIGSESGGDIRLTQAAQQADRSGVEREVCITNTGARETRGLAIQDLIEVEKTAGVFEPLPGMQLDSPVNRELVPHERWCQVERIDFSPSPEVRHRLTTTVSITNHAELLPGSPQCPVPEGCPYRQAISAILQIPSTSMLIQVSTPTAGPLPPPETITSTSRPVFAGNSNSPPENPPDEAPPPPVEPAPSSPTQNTPTPLPRKPTPEPEPTRTPEPTRPPAPPAPTATDRPEPTQPPEEDTDNKPKPTKPPEPDKDPKPTKPPKPDHEPKPTKKPK